MFASHIADFNDGILSLRDFVDLIEPILIQRSQERDSAFLPLLMKAAVQQSLKKSDEQSMKTDELLKLHEEINFSVVQVFGNGIEVEFEKKEGDTAAGNLIIRAPRSAKMREHLKRLNQSAQHVELLYKNSFISMLSSVELFFAQILHFYYDSFPGSAGISDKSLKLSDLKNFASVKDAERHLIEIKIEEILRGSFDSWVDLLKKEFKLGLKYVDGIKDELVEIYQRRNLLVHNGGIVNSIYQTKVSNKFASAVKPGQTLTVDKEYLDNAINKLQLSLVLIACELWKKLKPTDCERGEILGTIVYENLLASRWGLAEGLSYFCVQDSEMSSTDKLVAQLNYWLCKRRTGNFSSIETELNKADFSDKKEIFQIALAALQDKKDLFFELLPKALESEQITAERVEEFPIFEEMRGYKEYEEFKKISKYFQNIPIQQAVN